MPSLHMALISTQMLWHRTLTKASLTWAVSGLGTNLVSELGLDHVENGLHVGALVVVPVELSLVQGETGGAFCTECGGRVRRPLTRWIDLACGFFLGPVFFLVAIGCRYQNNEISWPWFAAGVVGFVAVLFLVA